MLYTTGMRLLKYTLLYLFFCFWFLPIFAQNFELEDLELEKSKSYGNYVLGIDKSGYIYTEGVRQFLSFRTYWLKVYDPSIGKMVAEKSTQFKELKNHGYRYLYFRFIQKKPVLILKSKNINDKNYYAIEIDQNLNLLGMPYIIGKQAECGGLLVGGTGKSVGRDLKASQAPDRTITFFTEQTCSRDKDLTFQTMVLNEFGGELYSAELTLDSLNPINSSTLVSVNERQSYFYVTYDRIERVEGRLFRKQMNYQRLFSINSFGDIEEIDLDISDKFSILSFEMTASAGELLVTGLLSEVDKDEFIGIFSGKIDPTTNQFTTTKTHLFSEEFATQYWTTFEKARSKRRADEPSLGSGFKLLEHFTTPDSGAVYFAQKYELKEVAQTTTSPETGGRLSIDYHHYYTDLVVLKVNKSGELVWHSLIPIEQHTVNYDPGKGFVAAHQREEIVLLHLSSVVKAEEINSGEVITERRKMRDRVRNEMALTRISAAGEVSSNNILNLRENRLSFDVSSISVNQPRHLFILVNSSPSLFKRKHTRLSIIDYSPY